MDGTKATSDFLLGSPTVILASMQGEPEGRRAWLSETLAALEVQRQGGERGVKLTWLHAHFTVFELINQLVFFCTFLGF